MIWQEVWEKAFLISRKLLSPVHSVYGKKGKKLWMRQLLNSSMHNIYEGIWKKRAYCVCTNKCLSGQLHHCEWPAGADLAAHSLPWSRVPRNPGRLTPSSRWTRMICRTYVGPTFAFAYIQCMHVCLSEQRTKFFFCVHSSWRPGYLSLSTAAASKKSVLASPVVAQLNVLATALAADLVL
jgi:hypothetical protein